MLGILKRGAPQGFRRAWWPLQPHLGMESAATRSCYHVNPVVPLMLAFTGERGVGDSVGQNEHDGTGTHAKVAEAMTVTGERALHRMAGLLDAMTERRYGHERDADAPATNDVIRPYFAKVGTKTTSGFPYTSPIDLRSATSLGMDMQLADRLSADRPWTGGRKRKLSSGASSQFKQVVERMREVVKDNPYLKNHLIESDFFSLCEEDDEGVEQGGRKYQVPRTREDARREERILKQLQLEMSSIADAVLRYKEMKEGAQKRQQSTHMPVEQDMLREWYDPLVKVLMEEQHAIMNRVSGVDRQAYGPYVVILEPEKLAVIVLHSLLGTVQSSDVGCTFSKVAGAVGAAVASEIRMSRIRKGRKGGGSDSPLAHLAMSSRSSSSVAQRALHGDHWDTPTMVKVGAVLVSAVLDTATVSMEVPVDEQGNAVVSPSDGFNFVTNVYKRDESGQLRWILSGPQPDDEDVLKGANANVVDGTDSEAKFLDEYMLEHGSTVEYVPNALEEAGIGHEVGSKREVRAKKRLQVPAFAHYYKMVRGAGKQRKKVGMIAVHPEVVRRITEGHRMREHLHPQYLPMVSPPRPWTSPFSGGFLKLRTALMRTKGSRAQVEALRHANLTTMYSSLDALGSTPWRVNKNVFEVAWRLWEAGGGICDLPQREDVPLPPAPDLSSVADLDEQSALLGKWRRQCYKARRDNANLHSLRCDTVYKFNVAQKLLGTTLYFPHNVDFRGRAYPIPPHLNHMGSDLNRGLLSFASPRPLGEDGYFWLKVHLANLMGNSKVSFAERAEWAEENMEQVVQCAEDPMRQGALWQQAECPWQFLGTCFELSALKKSGREPSAFMSSLPVHQDGSCNGLQHYAALGRDEYGAREVNLLPAAVPQDIYSEACAVVRRAVERDAANGCILSKQLVPHISRKVVKQTIMTSVYGVTLIGARRQIANRLRGIDGFPEEIVVPGAHRLADHTLNALGEIFSGARAIMHWLTDCARVISTSANDVVRWTSPLGLPVVQPYRHADAHTVRTMLQHLRLLSDSANAPVMKAQQRTAFPPNYIHSLDSTHMLMTALSCRTSGITFAAVHDSYWTHAGDVGRMNSILRDQFIHLHSQPLLEDLLESFRKTYPTVADQFAPIPERGKLNLSRIRDSKFFFH